MKNLGLVELIKVKKEKENTLWALGFRLAPRELFDTLCEVEKEMELRLEQIKELKKEVVIELIPELDEQTINDIYDLIEKKEFDKWLND